MRDLNCGRQAGKEATWRQSKETTSICVKEGEEEEEEEEKKSPGTMERAVSRQRQPDGTFKLTSVTNAALSM